MKYFAIENSLNDRIQGKIPQVKEHIFNCHVDDTNFIDNFNFNRIESIPILANVVLDPNALQTDLIESGGMGFSFGSIVVSEKLKKILDCYNIYGLQYFNTYIIQNNKKIDHYFQTHFYDFPFQYIDFKETIFLLSDRDIHRNVIIKEIKFNNTKEFLNFTSKMNYPKMIEFKKISFISEMDLDYFFLRFSNANKGIISEKLKNEIENQYSTGIEFRPIDLSYNEWTAPGGERERVYGKA